MTKKYLEKGYIIYTSKNRLRNACGDVYEILDYMKEHHISIPKRAWLMLVDGAWHIETPLSREYYTIDHRFFKGLPQDVIPLDQETEETETNEQQ